MKLGVSTSCCFDWKFDDIIATAKDLGFKGIEIRKLGDSVFAPRMSPFSTTAIAATTAKLAKTGIEIAMLSSSAVVGKESFTIEALAEVRAYTELAQKLGTPFIRVLAGSRPDDYDCDLDLVIDTLAEMCGIAAEGGISVLVETNSIFSDVTLLKEVLDRVDRTNIGALWDINYPYRYFGEQPSETVDILGKYIKYVHTKDSIVNGETIEYRLMGHGDLPLADVFYSLKSIDYDGYLSFEWIPKWSSELVEPGIVMAQYAGYMLRELKKYR